MMMINFPEHLSLNLSHNEHKAFCQTVKELIDQMGLHLDFLNEGDREKCIEMDEIWMLNWNPTNPVGFRIACASTLEILLELVNNEKENRLD